MPDIYDDNDGLKVTTAFILNQRMGVYWLVLRAGGDITNPGVWSFPGSDGETLHLASQQASSRLGLGVNHDAWVDYGRAKVDSTIPHEWKRVLVLARAVELTRENLNHESGKYVDVQTATADQIAELQMAGQLSPAAWAVWEHYQIRADDVTHFETLN